MLLLTISQIIGYLVSIIIVLVIVQFVMSLLISFNVVNMQNNFVEAIWRAVNALLDPILNPIRKIMPNTGAIDFSPLLLPLPGAQPDSANARVVAAITRILFFMKPDLRPAGRAVKGYSSPGCAPRCRGY